MAARGIDRASGAPGPQNDNDRIALYIRLSRVFRQQIVSGAWGVGARLPTIAELGETYGVAAITVRQALRLLAHEGLVESTRGRGTFVTGAAHMLDPATGGPALEALANPEIRILRRISPTVLPDSLEATTAAAAYTRIDKVHFADGAPFALMEIYIDSDTYALFPSGADEVDRISVLFRRYERATVVRDRQVFMIAYADRETAAHLACSLGTVLIHMRAWWFDQSDRVVFAGSFLYRGDRFALERGGPHPVGGLLPTAQRQPDI
ncbi:GntR family transcriptional regulator [Camelimonas sp. ID_303_24]